MNLWRQLQARFRALLGKQKLDTEMDEEIRLHIEMRTQEKIKAGMSPEEARYAALRQFGWVESIKETCRDQRGVGWIEHLVQDVRYGVRMLRMNPGFTAVTVLTLALGIGANTAIFSVVDGVLLKPLQYDQPGQLVQVWEAPSPGKRNSVSPGVFLDWKQQSVTFDSLAAFNSADLNLTGIGEPERVNGLRMSASGLNILRARALIGRTFAPGEDQPGQDKVVVLTHRLWPRRFGGETNEENNTWEIVGIVGDVRLRGLAEKVRPLFYRPQCFGSAYWNIRGNLVVRMAVAPHEMAESIRQAIIGADPDQPVANVRTMEDVIAASVVQRRFILMLLGVFAGAALLLAAIGLYGVIDYAVSQRTREIGIRMTLGATRSDVLGLVFRQGMKLVAIGILLGVLGALGLTRVLVNQLYEIKPTDPLTFVGVSLVLLLVALPASWLPARRTVKVDPMEALRYE